MKLCSTLSVFGLTLLVATNASALVIRAYDSSKHDLHTNFPNSPGSNPSFYHSQYDFSGVGWSVQDSRKHFALISSRHFVAANHYLPAQGSQIAFLNQSGQVKTYVVARLDTIPNSQGEPTDLTVGTLRDPIPATDGITSYGIAGGAESLFNGQRILVVGQSSSVGEGTISGFLDFGGDPLTGGSGANATRAYQFLYASFGGTQDDSHCERGDSGSPSFVASGGQLSVVGIHTAILTTLGSTASVDTFVPAYASEIAAIMDSQQDNQPPADPIVDTSGSPGLDPGGSGNPSQGEPTAPTDPIPNEIPETADTDPPGAANPPSNGQSLPPGNPDPAPQQTAYETWAENLSDSSYQGDPDGDGIVNLLEYAHGGDPFQRSQVTPGGQPILPHWTSPTAFSYLRRRQVVSAQVDYRLEVSAALADWKAETTAAGYFSTETQVTPLDPPMQDFERVTSRVMPSGDRARFTRLRVAYQE